MLKHKKYMGNINIKLRRVFIYGRKRGNMIRDKDRDGSN